MAFSLIYIAAIFGIFYFLLIRPQQKRAKEMQAMRDSVKVGDSVVSIGGIVGKVTRVTEDDVVVETGAGQLTFKKFGISSVSNEKEEI